MFRLYLQSSLILFVLFTVLVAGIQVTHYRGNPVDALVMAQGDCSFVCIFAIQPGKTTVGNAKTLLNSHSWVVDVQEFAPGTGYANISWGWSGKQPHIIDTSRRGMLTFVWDDDDPKHTKIVDSTVETVSIYTRANLYMFEKTYGHIKNGAFNHQLEDIIGYAVYYNTSGGNIGLRIDIPCPVTLASYWSANVRMTASIGQNKSQYVSPMAMMELC